MGKPKRIGWGPILAGVLTIVCVGSLGAASYWQYVNSVPPFRPHLPPPPRPNGFAKAEAAVIRLSNTARPPLPKDWPEGTTADLRAQVSAIHPELDQVRAAMRLPWQVTPVLRGTVIRWTLSRSRQFPECARCFVAEAILARREGDAGRAMQRTLDAMELGCKIARGGAVTDSALGPEWHLMCFGQAERLVPTLPASAVPAALERVRRVRHEWPSVAEMLEDERITTLAFCTELFQWYEKRPLTGKWDVIRSYEGSLGPWRTACLALTPRRTMLADLDAYYRRRIAESKKPFQRRVPLPLPDSYPLAQPGPAFWPDESLPWEQTRTDYALLEVGLVVRMHYLEHGRYPTRLTEISRRWLPEVPRDLWDRPIAYRLTNGQPVIYSLGPDGKDNGGQPADPINLTPATRGDLVFGHLSHHLHGG